MRKYYYKKQQKLQKRKILRLISLGIFLTGAAIAMYVFFPLLSWQIYFAPVFASQNITAPIPQNTVVSASTIGSLIEQASNSLAGVDYSNAQNWFPNLKFKYAETPKIYPDI